MTKYTISTNSINSDSNRNKSTCKELISQERRVAVFNLTNFYQLNKLRSPIVFIYKKSGVNVGLKHAHDKHIRQQWHTIYQINGLPKLQPKQSIFVGEFSAHNKSQQPTSTQTIIPTKACCVLCLLFLLLLLLL